jgi:ABC-type spermidine/putrescine transport system permease subunit II
VLGIVFLYLPIVILVIYSFNASRLVAVWGGWSTQWYAELAGAALSSKQQDAIIAYKLGATGKLPDTVGS